MIQSRIVEPGEYVGYAKGFRAERQMHVATLAAGYADGIARAIAAEGQMWHGEIPCKILGRISMDMIAIDISHLDEVPEAVDLIGPHQTIDKVASYARTIGYEILTSLGHRYTRRYHSGSRA